MGFRAFWLIGPLLALCGAGLVAAACNGAATPAGEGQECLQATDCAQGLICLPPSCNSGKAICSSSITCAQKVEGLDSGTADSGLTGDGPSSDSPPGSDTGTSAQDTGTAPADTGAAPQDTGASPQDTGTTAPPDSGTTAPDTSVPSQDSGSTVQDTGSPPDTSVADTGNAQDTSVADSTLE